MISDENVLSFLDLLDLDEELIDSRLKSIMSRREISDKHLVSAIHLLQYKQLVNLQENSECDNEEEYEFCTKLVREVNVSNIENVCKIITIALGLNSSTLVNKCEHFIQQILSELPPKDEPDDTRAILILKVTDSILHAVSNCSTKLFLPLLEIPVKNILCSSNENMKIQFLSSTVPKMFAAVTGFNILDSIWDFVKHLHDDNRSIALKVLSSLSDYYLPTPDNSGVVLFESKIVLQAEFWQTILYGLLSTDLLLRKLSIYLAKRALDCVLAMKKDVLVEHNGNIIFQWIHAESNSLKTMWDNYFILIDSLEEKQSNIVLPSLNLFPSLKAMGHWLNCAFNIGLKHDNIQVRLKCINHRLEIKLNSKTEAIVLLEALNYINIYDNTHEVEALKKKFSMFVKDKDILLYIIASIPMLQWSPVPLYHLSCILSDEDLKNKITLAGEHIVPIILDILKIPCNNVPLRKAIHINIAYFVGNCCSGLHWREYANIYLCLQMDLSNTSIDKNPFLNLIKKMINEDGIFFDFIQQSYLNIDFGLFYLQQHKEELPIYIDILHEKIKKIDNITNRHYSDKRECLDDVIYLNQLICKTDNKNHDNVINIRETINTIISSNFKTILLYISSLLVNNTILTIEEIALISDGLHSIFNARNIEQIKEAMLQLYKMSVLFTKDKNVALESVILSLHIIHGLTNNSVLLSIPEQERLNVQDVLKIAANFESKQSIGRLRNMFYEKSCEIVFEMLNQKYCCTDTHTDSILEYIQVVLDCGGYGCLQLCLKIINKMLPFVLMRTDTKFNMEQFICRMWKEIEELKSNNQYTPCIREFINLITHEHLLRLPTFNNIVLLYCKKIVDYGPVKVTPLFYLISKLNSTVLTVDHGHVIYILCDILMFSPVPRKDQRIIENLLVKILKEAKYGFDQTYLGTHFNFEVNYCSVLILSKIKDTEILCTIEKFIKNKIDESFKNKQRYHGHSQGHRLLLTGLQHLLLISLMKVNNSGTRTDPTEDMNWCIELLKKLPHQISVRICLEWYIALHLVKMKISLNEELLESFNDIPLISQLFVLYWTAKRIILSEKDDASGQFEFVMDFLLCHTMGPMFNTRLHAQYLATKLNEVSHIIIPKYPFIMTLIERTFKEGENDKNYVKIKDDYFINNFDIIQDLTPSFIYYFLPKYCEINNEFIDIDYVRSTFNAVNSNISDNMLSTDFHKEWVDFHRTDDEIFSLNICNEEGGKLYEGIEASGTIQKKYVPWKNMSDVYVYEAERKVAMIFGVDGACRGKELLNISIEDIQKHSDQLLLVTLNSTKTKRSFVVRNERVKYVEKYMALRPSDVKTNRFFLHYLNGKCTRQVIGKNKIGTMPREIATYLKLPNPELYTGHCFRRTSAALSILIDPNRKPSDIEPCTTREVFIEDPLHHDIKMEVVSCAVDPWTSSQLRPSTSKGETDECLTSAPHTEVTTLLKHSILIKRETESDSEYITDSQENPYTEAVLDIKKENKSELIVVASLIDKLPNLGGMARTSEVFGVKTYVVDSLRHLQDKQFQSLSVSAERWINVEEVRPGQALKQYLIAKKSEGYCVVAAEQTSTSVKLQNFQFPMKTLLLLGHEKEGIPCDLLPIMDYCVEIPQQGFVRSLNVHVTAAIFIWEYTRQNIL